MNAEPHAAFTVRACRADHPDALAMQGQLSAMLLARYGSDGKAGFADFADEAGAVFAVAYGTGGEPVGCGALRPLRSLPRTGEIKRMHAMRPGQGIGSAVLGFLEDEARRLGYRQLCLSTRRANHAALAFYQGRGFGACAPYGHYVGRAESACLSKALGSSGQGDAVQRVDAGA
jgi:GNAT superfamily N-acetyltransferase